MLAVCDLAETICKLPDIHNSPSSSSTALSWSTRSYSGAASVRLHCPASFFLVWKTRTMKIFANGIQGLAVRFWQLGLEMRPFFNKESLWVYPVFAGAGASFGYWMMGVENKQQAILSARRASLLEKRQRRAEREAAEATS
jgi:hypothetical protein